MTYKEFLIKSKEFEDKGYSKNFKDDDPIQIEGNYFYKTIEYGEDNRAINILVFKIYNFEKYADRTPGDSYYSFEPVVTFSRTTDERIDLHIHFPEHSIEFIEEKAKQFGEWCKQYM